MGLLLQQVLVGLAQHVLASTLCLNSGAAVGAAEACLLAARQMDPNHPAAEAVAVPHCDTPVPVRAGWVCNHIQT
jgi:hypothetical protein